MSTQAPTRSVTVPGIKAQKGAIPIAMLTAYDYPTARLLDQAGVDILLVGDSLGTVLYGEPNTLGVTMEDMIRHTRAVARGSERALVVADMPFMSYQVSPEQAVANAGRLLKEAHAHAVKLEGGLEVAPTIAAITRAGIPVCAHIGLTPQTIHAMGTYRMHGKSDSERGYLLDSARAVAKAGAFAVVLECVEPALAREITQSVDIPTIGIGAGSSCDGQVLVVHDLVGLTQGRVPRFVEPTARLHEPFTQAVRAYVERVRGETPKQPPAFVKAPPALAESAANAARP